MVVLIGLLTCGGAFAGERAREKTVNEIVSIAKSPARGPLERVEMINKLSALTDSAVIRDNRVVEELIVIGKPNDKKADIFVRASAIDALAKIQKIDQRAKDKFLPAFSPILKDKTEHMIVARAVASNFKESLDKEGLPDRDAYKIISELAKDKATNLGLRQVAIDTVGTFGAIEGLDILLPLLSEPEQLVREHAASAIYDLMARVEGTVNMPLPAVNKLVEMVSDKTFAAELKVNVMKVLGTLVRDGNMAAKAAIPEIVKIVANEQDEKLVKGGIVALGLIGSGDAVEPLIKAYNDFVGAAANAGAGVSPAPANATTPVEAPKPVNSKETDIRKAIMDAFISILANQGQKPNPDMKVINDCVNFLLKVSSDDADVGVKKAAVFALRYVYPTPMKVPAHKNVGDVLCGIALKEGVSEDLKREIVDTLRAISGQDFGNDYKRWDDYWAKTYK
jgi:HEAT repeat protein